MDPTLYKKNQTKATEVIRRLLYSHICIILKISKKNEILIFFRGRKNQVKNEDKATPYSLKMCSMRIIFSNLFLNLS